MENLDEKHVEMLRTNLAVYEVDGIQCQLTFQKKTITLEVTSSTSFSIDTSNRSAAVVY